MFSSLAVSVGPPAFCAAFDVELDVLRRQQDRLMAEASELARPVMRRPARLDPDPRRVENGEKLENLASAQLLAQRRPLFGVDRVLLKKTARTYPYRCV
jgi:hypothetical protein